MNGHSFTLATILGQWLNNPQAVTSAIIAFFGGSYFAHRFRAVPRGRERETLEAMQQQWKTTGQARGAMLRTFPPLVRLGREAVLAAADESPACPADLRRRLERWPEPTGTAAHEVLVDEAKFRSLLWAVMQVKQAWAQTDPELEVMLGLSRRSVEEMRDVVNKLNDFAQLVELDLFEQSDVLGLLHRSIGPICKAAEPVIWADSADGKRWGLRIHRLRLRAEHFNDVVPIHRATSLRWSNDRMASLTYHEALFERAFDRLVPTPRLAAMSSGERSRLRTETFLARFRHRYGGARLRRHTASENRLAGQLQYAMEHDRNPLTFDWTLADLQEELRHPPDVPAPAHQLA
jgi:hypothetical protein